MKKNFFKKIRQLAMALGLMASAFMHAQNTPANLSPDGLFDQVFDKYGNTYKLEDVMISSKPKLINGLSVTTQTLCTSSGYFDLYFETGSGCEGTSAVEVARRNVLCQLFSDLSNFIVPASSSTHVKIWVRNIANITTANGVLGLASSFYTIPTGAPTVGGIVDGEVWKTIHAGTDSYTNVVSPLITTGGTNLGFYHGILAFNFNNFNWHTNLGAATSANTYDLYSVGLHEVIHALGFASLINYNGNSKLGTNYNYYSRYDLFLQNQSGQSLITNTGACTLYNYQFNPLLNANTLLSPNPASCGNIIPYNGSLNSTTCGTAVKFAGSVNQAVYTPNCFEPPSSLSHLEDVCHTPTAYSNDAYYVMSNANGSGSTYMKRFPKPEERAVLCDIGYRVNGTYGNNLYSANSYNYNTTQCPGLWVGGVNDGITSSGTFQWTTPSGMPITISSNAILNNDFQANAFECLEDVYGSGTLSTSNGSAGSFFTYTPDIGNSGVAVLRYVPVNANGEKGNITYVYIFVAGNGCAPTACNMIPNGNFESVADDCGTIMNQNLVNCWTNYTSSPDLFGRGCPNNYVIPTTTGFANPAADTCHCGPNNDQFIGLWGANTTTGYTDEESIQTILSTPLVAGQQYTIRFQARVANGTGILNIPANIAICGSPSTMASTGPIYSPGSPFLSQLTATVIPADMAWHSVSLTFTYNNNTSLGNLNNLIIGYDASMVTVDAIRYLFLDNIELSPTSSSVSFAPPTPICVGSVINNLGSYGSPLGGTITGTGVSGSPGSYVFTGASAGTYNLTYTYQNSAGCVTSTTTPIVVSASAAPSITVVASPSVSCVGGPVTLTASGASTYVWSPAVSCTSPCNMVTVSPTSDIIYTVTGTTGQCSTTATIAISVTSSSLCCKQADIAIPGGSTSSSYPSLASGQVVEISGVFTINANTTYTGVNFRMLPGSKININAGNVLTLTNCHLFSCSDMWDGVYLLQSGSTAGNIIMSSSTLEDAINGIVANSNNVTSVNPLVRVINTTFNKNLNSIQYLNQTGSGLASLDIQRCKFTCTNSPYSLGATLKAPYQNQRSQKGVVLSSVNNVQVGSSASAAVINQFDNLDYGIYVLNTNVKIINNNFSMTGGLNGAIPVGVGVYSPNASMVGGRTMTIGSTAANEGNIFNEVFRGVDITNIGSAFVNGNRFTATTTPALFTAGVMGLTSQHGVYLTHIQTSVAVLSNTLTNYSGGITHVRNQTTSTSYNPRVQLSRNVMNTSGSGYVARGIYLGDVTGNTITTFVLLEIRDNTLSDMLTYGIYAAYIRNGLQIIGSNSNAQSVRLRYQASSGMLNPGKHGIIAVGCEKVFISYNSVSSTSPDNTNISGITLKTSTSSLVKCNNIYTIGTCITVDGNCTSPYTSAASYAYGVLSNNFKNAKTGIYLMNGGILGQQGDATHPTENAWNGTPTSYTSGQTSVDNFSSATNSPFYCRSTLTALWPTIHQGALFGIPYVNNTTILSAWGDLPTCPVPTASFVVLPSDTKEEHAAQHTGQLSVSQTDADDFHVNVYPNPNNGLFTLAADLEMKDVTIRVFNLMGEVLIEKTFKTFRQQEINLSEYSNGVYNIHIHDANHSQYYKVIKQ